MSSFKSNENIRKKEDGSYYVVSANKPSSVFDHWGEGASRADFTWGYSGDSLNRTDEVPLQLRWIQ